MQQQGYTMVWFGWQPDVVAGKQPHDDDRCRWPATPTVAPITGVVRNEITVLRPTNTLSLQSGWFTPASAPYPTVSTDNKTPLADGFPADPDGARPRARAARRHPEHRMVVRILRTGQGRGRKRNPALLSGRIQAGRLYELTYRAAIRWCLASALPQRAISAHS